jgi:hypothetical protein
MKRAERRHQKQRMKQRARRIYSDWSRAECAADNLTLCSGPCCGNPRKWFKEKTRQELREDGRATTEFNSDREDW